MPFWGSGLQPAAPPGYDYDYFNTDILLHHTSVTPGGAIHVDGSRDLPEDITYRLLVLPPTTQMTQRERGPVLERHDGVRGAGASKHFGMQPIHGVVNKPVLDSTGKDR